MKEYLGDSVYVEWNGYDLILTTENGFGPPSNSIVLEESVYSALQQFVNRLRESKSERPE